jgi:hypothetical protein
MESLEPLDWLKGQLKAAKKNKESVLIASRCREMI